jgi:CelD/BcsL family acetyltransferase involved in cellulose biosynthesis
VSLQVARTYHEVEALRPAWEQLQNDYVTSDVDFFLTYCRHTPNVVRPHAVLLEEDGAPAGLVASRLEDVHMPAKLAHKVVLNSRLRALTVVYGGLLCGDDRALAGRLLAALQASLADEPIDLVRVRMLPVGSPKHVAVTDEAPMLRRQRFAMRMPHWRSELPGSLDDFLARRSRRRRETVRRYSRRLERTYGDDARVAIIKDTRGLDRLFADSKLIHRETYQHILGVGFSDETVQRRLAELCAERGWFRGYMLYLRETPAAFWHGNAYGGVFGIGATGFDPAFAEDRPGTYLLMRAVEDLCADESVHTLDFGFGDADYKRNFGDGFIEEEDVVVFAGKPRGVAVNALHTALGAATAAGRAVATRTGSLGGLRRRRRTGEPTGLLRSFLSGILVLLAVYAGAGLAAGPANARGPEHTMSSEMIVDGARRVEPPTVRRRTEARPERPAGGTAPRS